MATVGEQVLSAPAAYLTVAAASNNLVAVDNPAALVFPSAGWITAIGVWARKTTGSPQVTLAAYARDAAGAPAALLGRTNKVTASNTGANAEGTVVATASAQGGPETAIRVDAGQVVLLALKVESGSVDLGVLADTATRPHFRRTIGSNPTDPFGYTSTGADQPLALYCTFVPSSAPSAPGSLSPASGANISNLTPTFSGSFVDADSGAPTRDKLRQYQVEVRIQGTTDLLMGGATGTFTATSGERSASSFSRDYAGTLVAGTAYEWRARVADDTLTYGPWTSWTGFTTSAAGVVTGNTPSGKQDANPATLAWTGWYRHPTSQAADRLQVRVLERGKVVKTGDVVTKSVAGTASVPGTAWTLTAAEAGIGKLDSGLALTFQARARSVTSGLWSEWSAEVPFSTNAIPTVPTSLSPPGGSTSTTRPRLEWTSSDDDDVEGTEVTWTVEITRPDTSVQTVSGVTGYDTIRGVAYYDTTATDVPTASASPYSWRARAVDTSAEAAWPGNGSSAWSKSQTFYYSSGPTVTLSSPSNGATIITTTPQLAWTAAGQVAYRLRAYKPGAASPLYDSGQVTSTNAFHAIPAAILKNKTDYEWDLTAWNNLNQPGTSLRWRFTVNFTVPSAVSNPALTTVRNLRDPEPTSVLFSWQPSQYDPGAFQGYVVRRRRSGQSADAATRLRTIPSLGQARFQDDHAPSGGSLVYSVAQLIRQGNTLVESNVAEAEIELDLSVVVIVSVEDPSRRCVLRWMPADRAGGFNSSATAYSTWASGSAPIIVAGPGQQRYANNRFTILDDALADRDAHLAALEELAYSQETVSYRDETRRFFGWIADFSYTQTSFTYEVDLRIEEVSFAEGEVDG